jgi:hypothetical protein|nr:MAG TPA: hypothetical protein [Caudoviricetes sp.]
MAKKYVKAYFDWIEQMSALSDAEKGRLFTAILEYARSGREPENSGREGLVFPTFKATLDREAEIAAINAENGAKGGRPVKPTETENNRTKPTKTENNRKKADETEQKPTNNTRHKTQDTMTQDIGQKTQDKSARTRDADAFAAFAAGDGDLLAVLKDFEKMRRSIKKPLTDTAKKLLVNKLENNFPPEQWKPVIEQSIVKCWQDIYPLKEQEQQRLGVVAHSEKASAQQLESLKEIYRKVKGE